MPNRSLVSRGVTRYLDGHSASVRSKNRVAYKAQRPQYVMTVSRDSVSYLDQFSMATTGLLVRRAGGSLRSML